MPIEVTSVPERRWSLSKKRAAKRRLAARLFPPQLTTKGIVVRLLLVLGALAGVVGGDALLRSYKYYARVIDARLASGYLTSRPGLYAAPRSLRAGQGFSIDDLALVLRRAGYVEKEGSDVWNGSFSRKTGAIELRPNSVRSAGPMRVLISFSKDNRIEEIVGDGATLESFTLEPEVLSNDLSAKTGRNRKLTFAEIPPVMVNAILAIEDRRFLQHSGIDLIGTSRALARNVRNVGEERGGQGGSTITQQLVKNTYLTPERTLRRKYAEAMLALALERRLSKEDIFALYCNEIYLGQRGAVGARGVEDAAQIYFGKALSSLTLSETATIAGMIQGPARYAPDRRPEAARARRNTVLAAMASEGFITNDEAKTAVAEQISVTPQQRSNRSLAPYFIDYVNRAVEGEMKDEDESRVSTTIDLEMQRLAEEALKRQLEKLDVANENKARKAQAALVALDPKTGNVLAMVGGRDYAESQLNRATDAHRQPGSTFKPFVYAAALESGLSPLQMFTDAPREFVYDKTRTYRPSNYGGGYSMRDVTMREGLVKSLNVVTVDIAMKTGLARTASVAERFGLTRPERYPSLALGTTEVTPLQLAGAYASFVNGGRKITPRVITTVAAPDLFENPQAVSPTTAYMITNMLSGVIDHGTARAARNSIKGVAVAGKTGTSRDGWFVGYTPNLVCVVWIGYDDNSQLGLTGAAAALPAWADFMSRAVALRPELGGRTFECPEGIKFVEVDVDNGMLSTLSCPHRELIAVAERVQPNVECLQHGNLPYEEAQQYEEGERVRQTVRGRSSSRAEGSIGKRSTIARTTDVYVDAHGRRTLVNDLR